VTRTAPRPRRVGPWLPLVVLIVIVDALLLGLAHPAGRALGSFTVAGVVAGGLFAATLAAIRLAARLAPSAALIAALGGYAVTVIVLGLVFLLLSPRVIDRWAVAAGLVSAVILWTTDAIRSSGTGVNEG
jgi:hypothetical protein